MLKVKYYRKNNIGRRYADGISAQKLSKLYRSSALCKIGYEVDMENSSFTMLYIKLVRHNIHHKYPILCKIRHHPFVWRDIIAKYYDESHEMAKKRLIKTLYGGLPEDENPFLWALLPETTTATEYLLTKVENSLAKSAEKSELLELPSSCLSLCGRSPYYQRGGKYKYSTL